MPYLRGLFEANDLHGPGTRKCLQQCTYKVDVVNKRVYLHIPHVSGNQSMDLELTLQAYEAVEGALVEYCRKETGNEKLTIQDIQANQDHYFLTIL
jgi:hypothetical protein